MVLGTKKNDIKPVIVIAGKDRFLAAQKLQETVNSVLTPEQAQTALLQIDGDKITAAEVFDELRTLPFLADRRVVVLNDADGFVSAYREQLERYFQTSAPKGILILMVESWPGNTRLAKILPKTGTLLAITELKSASLTSYLQSYAAEKHNKNLSRNSAAMLIELAGSEPGVLCCHLDKLAVYVEDAKTISEKAVAELVGRNRAFNVFEVIDAVSAGDAGSALEKLRLMFATDKEAEYTAVGAFAWHFRRLFSAAAMLKEGFSQEAAAKKLRIFYNKDSFFAMIRKTPLEKIAGFLRNLAEIDYKTKTGKATAQAALEAMLVEYGN